VQKDFALYEAYGTRPYEWSDGVTGDPDRQKANTKEEETDLGLLFEGMRIRNLYDGTFLTRDPIGYADGPNIYCYVSGNPITRFDPLGLSWWNPLTRDFNGYDAVRNTGRHLSEAGHQLAKGNPIIAARVTVGAATSALTGDLYDTPNPVKANETAVSNNGVLTGKTGAEAIANAATTATGQLTHPVKNDSHFLGIGDFLQTVTDIVAINTPSLNNADAKRGIAANHPTGDIKSISHSQGGSTERNGSLLVGSSINSRTPTPYTYGSQVAAKSGINQRGPGIVDAIVTHLDPRNLGNQDKYQTNPNATGHGFKNYGVGAIKHSEKLAEMISILDDMSEQ